jgi:hypothetical protein
MAHERFATPEYAREAGVDLWLLHPTVIVWRWTDPLFLAHARVTRVGHCLDLGDGTVIYAWFPQGVAAARERFPRAKILEMSAVLRRLEEKRLERERVTASPGPGE